MPKYLLLSYLPVEGGPTTKEEWADEHARWQDFSQSINDSGVLLSNAGLDSTEVATTVRVREGQRQVTDGPFAETKEYLAGYFLVDVPDLDSALDWAAQMPSSRHGAVEVRPLWGTTRQPSEA